MQSVEQGDEQPLFRYAFGGVEFDEARGELRVGGLAVELEQRPLQVLACLLHHADEVVPREELFDTVWAGRPTVDNVLANAVAKLRKALGAAEHGRIINLPRVGYRLYGPVERTVSGRRLHSRLDMAVGQTVPGREHFRLREQLGPSRGNEVWLARHDKTGEWRVYKFSADAAAGVRRQSVSEISLRSHLAHGDLAFQQMQVQPALDNYRAAQTMQQILHPDDALMSAHLLLGIAGCELRLDNAAAAGQLARQVLAGSPYTPQKVGIGVLALARSRLGDALRAQGHYAEAISVTRQAAADYETAQGASGQGTISALSSLSYLYSLDGDVERSLSTQRDVYQRALARWGSDNQYTLVEQLNLGSQEQEVGELKEALRDMQAAETGLLLLSGEHSPTVQAARVARANVLSDLGRNADALALVEQVDPKAYQASTADPGRAAVLEALRARILIRLGRREEGLPQLRHALRDMQADGVAPGEMAPYQKGLPDSGAATR